MNINEIKKLQNYLILYHKYTNDPAVQANHRGVLPQTLIFNLYISTAQCCRPLKFQTRKTVRLNSLSLIYQRFSQSGLEDNRIRQFEFVTKTQFLSVLSLIIQFSLEI